MLVTELGMLMLVKPLQSRNAHSPIMTTELGIEMLVRPEQPWNAYFPIVLTSFPIIYFITDSPNIDFSEALYSRVADTIELLFNVTELMPSHRYLSRYLVWKSQLDHYSLEKHFLRYWSLSWKC